MLIIFNKETGEAINNSGTNSLYPLGPENESEILEDVISRFGGKQTDYGILRLHDLDQKEVVDKTFTHEFTIQNGDVVFGAEKVFKDPTEEPSDIEKLQKENAMLQMSVMELSTYTALQDDRLQGQEQAILELSMLIAGGGA